MPPEYLMALMQSIENAVVNFHKEFPKLMDKDVEFVYNKLNIYFTAKSAGKAVTEPTVTSQLKQDLIDDILNIIDLREAIKGDIQYVDNEDYTSGGRVISSLASLYAMAFKRLGQSAKNWRKRNGQKGYLNYIQLFLQS
jgi:hypothetical protein